MAAHSSGGATGQVVREIYGFPVTESNTFLNVKLPGDGGDDFDQVGSEVRRTSSEPISSSSSIQANSISNSVSFYREADRSEASANDWTQDSDPEDNGGQPQVLGQAASDNRGNDASRYNLCKSKRQRMKKCEDQLLESIRQDPYLDLEAVRLPTFMMAHDGIRNKFLAKMLVVQRQAIAKASTTVMGPPAKGGGRGGPGPLPPGLVQGSNEPAFPAPKRAASPGRHHSDPKAKRRAGPPTYAGRGPKTIMSL
uniref:Uncharacterized protein n=1 Tax=Alexandrium andersonii TaxID=327968 RepID=A0A7S2N7T9_9DINO